MRKIFYAILVAMPLIFASCDNVDDDEKLVYPQGQTSQQTAITDTNSIQRVLLEDYTGWKCVNCPRAAVVASNLLNKYKDSLVVMAVHCGSFATPNVANGNVNFSTEYGEKWCKDFGITSFPAGLINRTKGSSGYYIANNDWESKVTEEMVKTHLMDINLGVAYRSQTNKILVSTQNVFLQDVSFPTLINVVVVESGLVGVQANENSTYGTTPLIKDYVFNHVLRKNGLVDYSLSSLAVSKGTKLNKNYLLSVDSDIKNINNCKVIVFVTNANTKEVVQVNEIAIK